MKSRSALLSLCFASLCAAAPVSFAFAATLSEADIANYTGADRQKMLEDGATKEGKLLLYATGTQIQPLLDAFHKRYPFVTVDMPRADAEAVARKVMQEYQAGYYAVDAFELSSYGLTPLRDEGLLQPFQSPEMKHFDASAIESKHNWVSVRESYVGIGYNTKIIPPDQAPKSFDDLLDPKWKGRMAVSSSMSTTANWVGAMVLTKGEGFVRKLGAQNFRVYAMLGRALANLTISGEAPLVPTTYDSHARASAAEGAPIAWNAPDAVPVTDTSVALTHPRAPSLCRHALCRLPDVGAGTNPLSPDRVHAVARGNGTGQCFSFQETVPDEPTEFRSGI